jgi:hypothetical protein
MTSKVPQRGKSSYVPSFEEIISSKKEKREKKRKKEKKKYTFPYM